MKTVVALWLILGFQICSFLAFAWGDLGHETVGEIAERNLSPEARAMVFDILGAEPMAVAAIFPDQVRPDPRFDAFVPYHYIEIPSGTKIEEELPKLASKKTADSILSKVPQVLGDPKFSRSQKTVLLKYLIHVAGDVHMPLHVGNGLDHGANFCHVNWRNPKNGKVHSEKLHLVWDELIFDYLRDDFQRSHHKGYFGYREVVDLALKAATESKVDLKKLSADPVLTWYKESRDLHSQVYPDKTADPTAHFYCQAEDPETHKKKRGNKEHKEIPYLGEEYARKSLAIALPRLAVAGYRLAYVLNQIAMHYPMEGRKSAEFEELLMSVQ